MSLGETIRESQLWKSIFRHPMPQDRRNRIVLMFYYRPTLEWAYNDILALRDVTSLGILRELHRWGAHAMVITVWLHMYRVFLTGSYKPPREFNWCIGVILLVLTL